MSEAEHRERDARGALPRPRLEPTGALETMITLRVEKRYGTATVKARVIAPSIEQALKLYGEEADIISTTQPTRFLSLEGPTESMKQTPVEVGERRAEAA